MTSVITGANGFSAYYLAEFIKSNTSDFVIGIDVQDNCSNSNFDKYFSINNFDDFAQTLQNSNDEIIFYHLGGLIGMHLLSDLINVNALWTSKYLELAQNIKNLKYFLNIGSSAEYGNQTETILTETLDLNPINNYGISKKIQSNLALQFGRTYNFPLSSTITFNIIGPKLNEKLVAGKIIKGFKDILSGEKSHIELGRMDSKRDFIDIRDAVKIYYLIAQKQPINQIINVASGKSYEINDIFKTCSEICKITPEIKSNYQVPKNQDVDFQYADISKMKNIIGNFEYISFEKSIEDMLNA
jgi:GDP-4-dehydro-6-deoxy-D-mannose reductase